MNPIEQLLRDTLGIDPATIGPNLIQRAIALRMNHLGIPHADSYLIYLRSDPREWDQLVESVVVTETWFFREREVFNALAQSARRGRLAPRNSHPLRILSLPCASGEEPHSLAMAFLDADISADQFQIEAFDISARALELARKAIYGRNSFRGDDLTFRLRHFRKTSQGYELNATVRACTTFGRANLLSDDFPVGPRQYDLVLCRNLLIYFDRSTQQRAIAKLKRLLAPGGLLVVGPAEQTLLLEGGLVTAGLPMTFAPSPRGAARVAPPEVARPLPRKNRRSARSAPQTPPLPPPKPPAFARTATHGATATAPSLDDAKTLANAGRLRQAAELCERVLATDTSSAPAYFLLGLIREAQGDIRAEDCYRRALYLDPHHRECLLQLALLAEKNGDTVQARNLKARAERARLRALA